MSIWLTGTTGIVMPCAMLRPWFRGGCHACFCRPDGWVPSVLVLCKHEVSPWLPKRTARSAPASFSPPSRKLPPVAAQKFQTAYHFMFDCEQLQTPLLATTTALIERRSCGMVWVAWTEFGSVGEGRRTSLRQIDKFSQIRATPGWTPSFVWDSHRPRWTPPQGLPSPHQAPQY